MKYLRNWWLRYRYRFVPWLALNLKNRSVRLVEKQTDDKLIPDEEVIASLEQLFTALFDDQPQNPYVTEWLKKSSTSKKITHQTSQLNLKPITVHLSQCLIPSTVSSGNWNWKGFKLHVDKLEKLLSSYNNGLLLHPLELGHEGTMGEHHTSVDGNISNSYASSFLPHSVSQNVSYGNAQHSGSGYAKESEAIHKRALRVMEQTFGFCIEKKPSNIEGGGTGVIVTKGTVPKHSIVALYPGLIYFPYEPILLQSIANPFIFRCLDGILIDGNDRGLSKFLYRSCAGRDRLGPFDLCDKSWLTPTPKNPLAIGQYVNNHNKDYPANVCYQECDLPLEFLLHLRQYVPNVFYRTPDIQRCVHMVVLVSLRDIAEGEELFSSYFTMLH